eukprot:scaffold34890_cov148-Skeletonema_menzelii.AAC.1
MFSCSHCTEAITELSNASSNWQDRRYAESEMIARSGSMVSVATRPRWQEFSTLYSYELEVV